MTTAAPPCDIPECQCPSFLAGVALDDDHSPCQCGHDATDHIAPEDDEGDLQAWADAVADAQAPTDEEAWATVARVGVVIDNLNAALAGPHARCIGRPRTVFTQHTTTNEGA